MDLATLGDLLAFAGVLATGLMAGLFFGWSVSALRGLRRVPDRTYVESMQEINAAILNPLFLATFMAAAPLLAAAAVVDLLEGATARAWWLAAAAVTYAVGVLGVTITRNVPLNEALARFDRDAADDGAVATARHDYEGPWNRWQTLRAWAVVLALGLAVVALLVGR